MGDIVFCKLRGRYIDAHKITKKADDGRSRISHNRGYDNGWTREVSSEDKDGRTREF